MSSNSQKLTTSAGLAITAALFLAVLLLSNILFSGWRLDLTENRLYTLSDGTKSLVSNLDEPIHLRFYFSQDVAREIAPVRAYGQRVEELLEEFVANSDGKLKLSVIDPEPFSEAEDEAAGFGLVSAPVGASGDKLYMGMAATNTIGDDASIVFFQMDREAFLEYEISKLLYDLANPQKRVIGLMSGLPITGAQAVQITPGQAPPQQNPWVITQQLAQFFELRDLGTGITAVPNDVDILMVVHPQNFSDASQYAIDQFVVGGGNAIFFVDPLAERQPQDPAAAMGGGTLKFSELNRLFNAWGFHVPADQIIADQEFALPVQVQQNSRPVIHLGLLGISGEAINRDEVMTAHLDSVNFGSAGFITEKAAPVADGEGAGSTGIEIIPLISSSERAQPIPAARMNYLPDPAALMRGFVPTGEQYALAARIHGKIKTAFADGAPDGAAAGPEHLAVSSEAVNMIVVADTDMLSDRLWVQIQNMFGQQVASPWANNGDFTVNSLDALGGSEELISIRSRGTFNRPFERVVDLRRDAELKFRDKEEELEAELRDTERKLNELQGGAEVSGNRMTLTADQQQAIEDFRSDQIRIRKELRDVRHQLDKDIEALGFWLELLNTLAIPLLIILLAIGLGIRRSRSVA